MEPGSFLCYNSKISRVGTRRSQQTHMALHTLMFGWEFPPLHSGGLGVACEGLVKGLVAAGTRITLVLPHDPGAAGNGVDVRFPSERETWETRNIPSLLQPYDDWAAYAQRTTTQDGAGPLTELYGPNLGQAVAMFTEQSVAMTRDVRADMVHCHDWMTFAAGAAAAAHHDLPLIAHIHATEIDRTNGQPDEWIYRRELEGMRAATKVIAVSNFTRDLLVSQYGIAANKISVVHNAHDQSMVANRTHPANTAKRKRGPVVLFLGRLALQKNPRQFLQIAKRVHALNAKAQFVMAGDGPMLPELLREACDMGLSDVMTFTGKVSRREAMALFASADCFVMPSLSEPFGLVALEAIAHGVPVILSKQSGVSEVIHHGFKVDFWDTDKMSDCILTILREEPLARQLRSEAPHLLRTLTWKNQARAINAVYRSILQS